MAATGGVTSRCKGPISSVRFGRLRIVGPVSAIGRPSVMPHGRPSAQHHQPNLGCACGPAQGRRSLAPDFYPVRQPRLTVSMPSGRSTRCLTESLLDWRSRPPRLLSFRSSRPCWTDFDSPETEEREEICAYCERVMSCWESNDQTGCSTGGCTGFDPNDKTHKRSLLKRGGASERCEIDDIRSSAQRIPGTANSLRETPSQRRPSTTAIKESSSIWTASK